MTDHIDQLLHLIQQLRDRLHAAEADAAEWKQACSGRTMSCSWCNDTAKKHDELKDQLQNVQFLYDNMMKRGVRPAVGERMNEMQQCLKKTQKQASELMSQLHHARKDRGQLRDAVRQYLQLDDRMHGRQWLKARERLKQLTNVTP